MSVRFQHVLCVSGFDRHKLICMSIIGRHGFGYVAVITTHVITCSRDSNIYLFCVGILQIRITIWSICVVGSFVSRGAGRHEPPWAAELEARAFIQKGKEARHRNTNLIMPRVPAIALCRKRVLNRKLRRRVVDDSGGGGCHPS